MGVLWLILKVLLGIVGILLAILILGILLILFLPIDYLVEGEKYKEITVYGKVRVFYILNIIYKLRGEENSVDLRLLGRRINKDSTPAEEVEKVVKEPATEIAKVGEKIEAETTEAISSKQGAEKSLAKKKTVRSEKPPKESLENSLDEQEEMKSSHTKSNKLRELWNDAETLWKNKYRRQFIRSTKRLLISLWRAIRPQRLQFDIIVGTGDPADTGELLAKASLLYPFYARYGIIQGEFEEKGIWGEIKTSGRLRLYQIIKPFLVFVIDKSVRNYIKIILNLRKEDKNVI